MQRDRVIKREREADREREAERGREMDYKGERERVQVKDLKTESHRQRSIFLYAETGPETRGEDINKSQSLPASCYKVSYHPVPQFLAGTNSSLLEPVYT